MQDLKKGRPATGLRSLTLSRHGGGAEIVLSRPDLLNRFDQVGEAELTAVLHQIAGDDDIRAVVLLAEGRAFSAGGDFELMLEVNADVDARESALQRARDLLHAITHLPQPLV